jgi:hypothetical protein
MMSVAATWTDLAILFVVMALLIFFFPVIEKWQILPFSHEHRRRKA